MKFWYKAPIYKVVIDIIIIYIYNAKIKNLLKQYIIVRVCMCFRCLPYSFFRDAHLGGCTSFPDWVGSRTTYETRCLGRLEHNTPLARWYRDRVVYSNVFRCALLQRNYYLVRLLPLQLARGKQIDKVRSTDWRHDNLRRDVLSDSPSPLFHQFRLKQIMKDVAYDDTKCLKSASISNKNHFFLIRIWR